MKSELDNIMESEEIKQSKKKFDSLPKEKQKEIKKEAEIIGKWFRDRGVFFYSFFLKNPKETTLQDRYSLAMYGEEFCKTFNKSLLDFIDYCKLQKLLVEHALNPFKIDKKEERPKERKESKQIVGGIGDKNLEILKQLKESMKEK